MLANVLLAAALLVPQQAQQAPQADSSTRRLFEAEEPIDITITTQLKPLFGVRDSTKLKSQRAWLSYAVGGAEPAMLDVEVRARGHWRRQRSNCDVPPLRITIPKKTKDLLKGTMWEGQTGNLKLVTHCRSSDEYQQYVLQEYLVYKVYNALTPRSFRARLARVTYTDSSPRAKPITGWGFLLEDDDDMAKRNRAEVLDVKGAMYDHLDESGLDLFAVFQYMVGGTDYSVGAMHNVVLIRDSVGTTYPVAYDFDWTGLVWTRYASPSYRLPVKLSSVRERLYRGPCRTVEQLAPTISLFQARKDSIYAIYRSMPGLDDKKRQQSLEFLDQFYETIGDPARIRRAMLRTCVEGT